MNSGLYQLWYPFKLGGYCCCCITNLPEKLTTHGMDHGWEEIWFVTNKTNFKRELLYCSDEIGEVIGTFTYTRKNPDRFVGDARFSNFESARKIVAEDEARIKAEEEAKRKLLDEAKRKAEEELKRKTEEEEKERLVEEVIKN